jgi:hypothetical protein
MEIILNTLETLSKYGIIDIVFGIGIFSLLAKLVQKKTFSDIENVDLLPYIDRNNGTFMLTIKNQSTEPLYLYQAYIEPGYYSEKVDKSSLKSRLITLMLKTWNTERFPRRINQTKTTKGYYILQLVEPKEGIAPTLFIEPYRYGEYKLDIGFENLSNLNTDDIFDNKQFGVLRLNFVKGTKTGQLEVQI